MPSLPKLKLPSLPNPKLSFGSRSGADVVGLDIQPGFVAAVEAKVNGAVLAQRAAALPLSGDAVREGEVIDQEVLAATLRELFETSGLGKRVRIGVANQRTVMRMLELPPVTDRKELAQAVRFQAQDQVPMPLDDAVLDFHPLGVIDTPGGPRQRVLLVAAQRDMVQRLLNVAEAAGLRIDGIDLSAFALIRSLHASVAAHGEEDDQRVLYLNVDGLTNLAIAEGTTCRFTRVVGGGMEALAVELAERRGIALNDARALIAAVDLIGGSGSAQSAPAPLPVVPDSSDDEPPASELSHTDPGEPEHPADAPDGDDPVAAAEAFAEAQASDPPSVDDHLAQEESMSYAEMYSAAAIPLGEEEQPAGEASPQAPPPPQPVSDADVRAVLENGIREISGQVRTSLEFYRSQDGGSEVSHVVMSGSALDVPGFAQALEASLGLEVKAHSVGLADESLEGKVSTHRLAVAAGLATVEAPR